MVAAAKTTQPAIATLMPATRQSKGAERCIDGKQKEETQACGFFFPFYIRLGKA
jgi:hypothetical protein